MIVLRRSLYGVVSDGCVGPFRSIADTSFDRISPGIIHFVGSGFGRIVFLSAVFVVFHSRYQNTLIPVPPSISPS